MKDWTTKVSNYFDDKSLDYDSSHFKGNSIRSHFEANRRETIEALIEGGGKLLDVACGTGYYINQLSDRFDCSGTDLSPKMVKVCQKKGLKNVQSANFNKLPFKDNSFDTLICINAFQYSNKPLLSLNEFSRVTKSGGDIILTIWNRYSLRSLLSFFLKKNTLVEANHFFYTFADFCKVIEPTNFGFIKKKNYNFGPWKMSSREISLDKKILINNIESFFSRSFLRSFTSEFAVKLINKK